MSDYLDPGNEELLKDFYVEAEMQVETLESNILALESDPTNADPVDEIFRAAHTLKGGAATVQMGELAEFTHLVEDALDEIRGGNASVDEGVVDTLLKSIDVIKAMLSARQGGTVFDGDTSIVAGELKRILGREAALTSGGTVAKPAPSSPVRDAPKAASSRAPKASASAVDSVTPLNGALTRGEIEELVAAAEGRSLYEVEVRFLEENPMNSVGGIQIFAVLKSFSQVLKTAPDFDELYADLFHPVVFYYIAADESPENHRSRLEISDVTDRVAILAFDGAVTDGAAADTVSDDAVAPDMSANRETPAPTPPAASAAPVSAPVEAEQTVVSEEIAVAQEHVPAEKTPSGDGRKSAGGSILRVDSRRIDNLLNLVSETVITKASLNQISGDFAETYTTFTATDTRYRERLKELFDSLPDFLDELHRGASAKDLRKSIAERFGDLPALFDGVGSDLKLATNKLRNASQNLGRIAGELQEGVMRIRMVPISQIFSRFPRLVRDLSKSLNKKIDLRIEGEETELDKSVIEDLLDPLIHCVRNSIDHGIEDGDTRAAKGKPGVGTVLLKASNEGNMILIEVSDDGKGIDVEAVRKKAVDRGVIHPNKQLSDIEAFNLIFDPGFSTAAKITNVSGRGVGLDVVKRQIEKLNGTVTVWSEKGRGTRFTIKLPLTLAIIQGLLVQVGPEMYAIPITSVIDSHRIKPSDIKLIDGYEVFNVREDVVSLVRLSRLFRIPTNENPEYHYVVIVGSNERKMGLVVDSLIGEEDVVIKPLRDHFTNSPGIAGANITGDGRVSLIIDVSQLLELGLRRGKAERARREMTIGK